MSVIPDNHDLRYDAMQRPVRPKGAPAAAGIPIPRPRRSEEGRPRTSAPGAASGRVTAQSIRAELERTRSPRDRRRLGALHRALVTGGIQITAHAADRAAELGYSLIEVIAAVGNPEVSYGEAAGARTYQRGDLAACAVQEGQITTVITVLLRTGRNWTHGIDTRRSIPRKAA